METLTRPVVLFSRHHSNYLAKPRIGYINTFCVTYSQEGWLLKLTIMTALTARDKAPLLSHFVDISANCNTLV